LIPGTIILALICGASSTPDGIAPAAAAGFGKLRVQPNPFTLQAGKLVGAVREYRVQRGDRISQLAVRFGIHPVRIAQTGARKSRDRLQIGEILRIDHRQIIPKFPAGLTGLVLNLPEAQLYLLKNGKLIKDYPVGVSSSRSRAPIGVSRILNKEINPTWYVPETIQQEMRERGDTVKAKVKPGPHNPLGTRWLGFGNGRFGFHGTLYPTSIKQYASHGCVRMRRPDVEDLYTRVNIGFKVYVVYQPVLLAGAPDGVHLCAFPDFYRSDYNYRSAIQQLAQTANLSQHLDWQRIPSLIRRADGIPAVVDRRLAPTRPAWTKPPTDTAPPKSTHPQPRATRKPPTLSPPSPSDDYELIPLSPEEFTPSINNDTETR
jgi:hypothetical protein